jgi:hypothetical protein
MANVISLQQQLEALASGTIDFESWFSKNAHLQGVLSQPASVLTPSGWTQQIHERRKDKAVKKAAQMDKEIAGLEKLEAEGMGNEDEVS